MSYVYSSAEHPATSPAHPVQAKADTNAADREKSYEQATLETTPGDAAQAKAKAAKFAETLRQRTGLYKLAKQVESTDYGKPASVQALLDTLYAEPWIGRDAGLNDAIAKFQHLIEGFKATGKFDPERENAFIVSAYALPLANGERDVSEDGMTPKEKEKRAKVLADYKAQFGDKIGQIFFTAMDDATSQKAIAGYAKQGSDAVFDMATGMLAKLDGEQKEDAAKSAADRFAAEYKKTIGKQVEEFMASPAGKRLLKKLGVLGFLDAAKENPDILLKAALVGGYIAYAQNPKLPTSSKVDLGKGHGLSLQHDFGKIQNMALQKVGATYSMKVPSTKKGAKPNDKTEVVKVGASYDKGDPSDETKPETIKADAKLSSSDGLNGVSGGLTVSDGEISSYNFNFNLADEFKKFSGGITQQPTGVTTANLFTQIGSKTHYGSAGVNYNLNSGKLQLDTKQRFGSLSLHQQYVADKHLSTEEGGTGKVYDAHQVFAGFNLNFGPGHKKDGPKDGMKYSIGADARYEIQDQELIGLGASFAMSKKDWVDFLVKYRFTHADDVSKHVFEARIKQELKKFTLYGAGNATVSEGVVTQGGGEVGALYKYSDAMKFGGIFGVDGVKGQTPQIKVGASMVLDNDKWVSLIVRPNADKLLPNATNPGIVSLSFKKLF